MPSLVIKSTVNCCSGRDPLSPEGLGPRPLSPFKASNKNLKIDPADPILTSSNEDVSELRAIFIDDEQDASDDEDDRAKAKSSSKLRALLLGSKSEESNFFEHIKPKTSYTTLKAATQKLKKLLSKEETNSKRHSRCSIGAVEEVEPRAELRRLRRKRIQEELSNEGIYDDDVKSLSSIVDITSSSCIGSPRSWVPGECVRLPALSSPTLPAQGQSTLDTRFSSMATTFVATPVNSTGLMPTPRSDPTDTSLTRVDSTATISRRHSFPVMSEWELLGVDSKFHKNPRRPSSLSPVPSVFNPQPTEIPTIAEPGKSSWRLSFASNNRGEHLRKLSQEHTLQVALNPEHLNPSTQPINSWLHSQGLRSPASPVSPVFDAGDIKNLESLASHSETCSPNQDFGGVDGVGDGSTVIHLHEMGISQRLASPGVQSSCSSPPLSSFGSHPREISNMIVTSQRIYNDRARYLRGTGTSDSVALSERLPQSWAKAIQDGASSFYPSAGNSIQPSPEGSNLNLMSLLAEARNRLDVPESKDREITWPSLRALAAENFSSASLPIPLPSPNRRPTVFDDSSILLSETSSYREREVELKAVQSRFANSETRRVPSTPRSSKFREEFDIKASHEDLIDPKVKRLSTFARLAKIATRSYGGPSGMEDLLGIPMPDFVPEKRVGARGSFSTPLNDSSGASAIWGKAIKKTKDSKAGDVGRDARKKSNPNDVPEKKPGFSWGRKKGKVSAVDDHESAAAEYQMRFEERMAVKGLVMDDWEAEMAAAAQKAKAKSRNIVKKNTPEGPDRRYPASWAKFPSCTRGERSASAGAPDNVDRKDSAIRGREEDGEIIWFLCKEDSTHHWHESDDEYEKHHERRARLNLNELWEEKISDAKFKLETAGVSALSDHTKGSKGGSMILALKPEYPELEVLPVTVRRTDSEVKRRDEETMREVEEAMKRGNMRMLTDGSADHGSLDGNAAESEYERSIADPKFYEDCVVKPVVEDRGEADVNEERRDRNGESDDETEVLEMQPKGSKKEKFKTWHGRDFDGFKYERKRSRNKNSRLDEIGLRKSTDDLYFELERMKKLERERVIRAVEEAWGKRK